MYSMVTTTIHTNTTIGGKFLPAFFPLFHLSSRLYSSRFVPTTLSLAPHSTLHTPHSRAALSLSKARPIAASYNDSNAKVGCGCLSNSAPNTEVGWCRDEYQRGIIVEVYRVFVRLLFQLHSTCVRQFAIWMLLGKAERATKNPVQLPRVLPM